MGAPWTGDANRTQGALLIRPAAFRAREPVDAPYRVRVHDLDGRLSLQVEFARAPLLLYHRAGRARLEISCPHCTRPSIDVEFPSGRTDTLDVYLSRLRNVCEVDATRAAPPP